MKRKYIVILPVCDADEELACENWALLARLTTRPSGYDAIIVTAKNRAPKALYGLTSLIAGCFNKVEHFEITEDFKERRWPYPQNNMFVRTCQHVQWNRKCDFFYYMEPDITPLAENPLERLFTEHEAGGKMMMGVPCTVRTADGKHNVSYINGAAIYPYDVMRAAPTIVTATHTSWDVLAREYTSGITHDGSKLMSHLFRAKEFVPLPDGKMEYTDMLDNTRKVVSLAGKVVCHGCKDNSLARLVMDSRKPKPSPVLLADPQDIAQEPSRIDSVLQHPYTQEIVEKPKRRIRRKKDAPAN